MIQDPGRKPYLASEHEGVSVDGGWFTGYMGVSIAFFTSNEGPMQMKPTIGRFFDGLFTATVLGILLSGGVLLYALSWSFQETGNYLQGRWFPDDAFYYFNVARNAALGYGLTFDRINPTNGFQPLWQAVCVGVHFLVSDRNDFLHAVNVVQSVLFALGMYLVFRSICLKSDARIFSIICMVMLFFYFPFFMSMVSGLETVLYFCCLSGTVYTLLQVERDGFSDRRALGLGLIMTATILARLDAGLLGVLVAIWVLWRRPSCRTVLRIAIPFVVFAMPYFVYNLWCFGSPMPVSGAVKRAWGAISFDQAVNHGSKPILVYLKAFLWPMIHPDFARIGVLVLVNLGLAVFYGLRREGVLLLLQLFFVLKYVTYVTLFHDHAIFSWYYTVDYMGPLIALPYFFGKGTGRFKIARGWIHVGRLVLIIPLAFTGYHLVHGYYWSVHVQLSHQLNVYKAPTPPYNELQFFRLTASELNEMQFRPDTVFASLNSGVLGYFMEYRVVNLDGLANGKTRLDYLRRYGRDFFHYIDEAQPVDGYIDIVPDPVKKAYDRSFITDRGFDYVPVKERINAKFGHCPTNGMIVYVKGATPRPSIAECRGADGPAGSQQAVDEIHVSTAASDR